MFDRYARAIVENLQQKPAIMHLFSLVVFEKMGLPPPIDHNDPGDLPFKEWEDGARAEVWREVAADVERHGFIAFGTADGVVVFTSHRWQSSNSSTTWAQHGAAEAERRLHARLSLLASFEPDFLQIAAEWVLKGTTREQVIARHAQPLHYFTMGVESAQGDWQRARRAAERALWAGFQRRIQALAGVARPALAGTVR